MDDKPEEPLRGDPERPAPAESGGALMELPDEAVTLECGRDPFHLRLATGERIQARAAVVATGARYRRLEVAGLEEFGDAGVSACETPRHYWRRRR